MAIVVGLISGYGAIAFRSLIGSLQNLFLYKRLDYHLVSPLEHVWGAWIIVLPAMGLPVVAWIVKKYAPEAKGHGVPEVIEAVFQKDGKIRKRIVTIKAFASALTTACGGSVGREGPIVQIGSAAGSTLGQMLKLRSSLLKILVGCGAGASVAATFNTPIGGVIFAVELIVLELKTKSFIPLVIASVIATMVSRFHLGNEPAFIVPEYVLKTPIELINYLGLGIFAGIISVLFIKVLYGMEDLFDAWRTNYLLKAVAGGLLLGLLAHFAPQTLGVGYETVDAVLNGEAGFKIMFMLIFLKIIATSLTLASGGSGGVFAPSLFIGAMAGGAYGSLTGSYFPETVSGAGAYALVGMAAMFAGTGRAAFSAIVIIFEMTLEYSIILPLMFACVISDQVSLLMLKESIYSLKLKRKGLSFTSELGANVMGVTPIKEIMTKEINALQLDWTLEEAEDFFVKHRHTVYPVIDHEGHLHGVVRATPMREKLKNLPEGTKISEAIVSAPIVAYPEETIINALKKVGEARDPRIFVVKRGTKKLLGIVAPRDLIRLNIQD